MNMLNISLCNPDLITDPQELKEALNRANSQIVTLGTQLDSLTRGCHGLTSEMAVMCEAFLAGDTQLVNDKVEQFATHYKRSVKPLSGRVH